MRRILSIFFWTSEKYRWIRINMLAFLGTSMFHFLMKSLSVPRWRVAFPVGVIVYYSILCMGEKRRKNDRKR